MAIEWQLCGVGTNSPGQGNSPLLDLDGGVANLGCLTLLAGVVLVRPFGFHSDAHPGICDPKPAGTREPKKGKRARGQRKEERACKLHTSTTCITRPVIR